MAVYIVPSSAGTISEILDSGSVADPGQSLSIEQIKALPGGDLLLSADDNFGITINDVGGIDIGKNAENLLTLNRGLNSADTKTKFIWYDRNVAGVPSEAAGAYSERQSTAQQWDLVFETGTTSLTEVMRLTHEMYLGLGTQDPNTKFDLRGGLTINGVTTVNTATYDVLVSDHTLLVTRTATGTCTVNIPSAQITDGRRLIIKDAGNANTNNITITTGGSETIDGDASVPISTDYGYLELFAENGNLYIVSG